jgi:hypothetical protein
MAFFRWQGNGAGTKTDWDDGRNWLDAAGAAYGAARYPGSVVAIHDDVMYDTALGGGALSTAGYDAVTAGDESLNSFRVGPDYNGGIGIAGAGGQVRINVPELYIQNATGGDMYIEGGTLGTGLERVLALGTKATSHLYLDGHIGDTWIEKGNVVFDASAIFAADATITVRYQSGILTDAVVGIPAAVTMPTTGLIFIFGGTITCDASLYELYVYNGKWTQANDMSKLGMTGGVVDWTSGDITAAVLEGGKLDGSNSPIPRVLDSVFVFRGATLDLDNGVLDSIVIGTVHEAWGGTTTWQPGDRLIQI